MRTLHLFAGVGGGLLADLILGHTPIAAVEWDSYCCAVLRERAADGWFPGLRVHEGDVRLFDPSEYAGQVDCIHAGFPCQDISVAGRGVGIAGGRSGLVSEVFRAIDTIAPRFVFLENSPEIRNKGREVVLGRLVEMGYAWRDGEISAADVGANHLRSRWFCVATNADGMRQLQSEGSESNQRGRPGDGAEKDVRHADGLGCEGRESESLDEEERAKTHAARIRDIPSDWWATAPDLVRVAHGIPHRAHRIKGLGNGQVPLQAAAAWKLLGGP